MKRPRVLAFVDYYLPGFKGGGPMISVSRFARAVSSSVEFFVFTRDRDLGDERSYGCARHGEWVRREEALVWYAAPDALGLREIARVVRDCDPDIVYLNSFFSITTLRALMLRKLGQIDAKVIIAPRGELSPGALAIKRWKKLAFIAAARALGLYRGVLWKPSTPRELREIESVMGQVASVVLPETPAPPIERTVARKSPGECRFTFVSRVSRKKNLEFAISLLRGLRGDVHFSVYGPFDDEHYERELRGLASELPSNVCVAFKGPVVPGQVSDVLAGSHFFLFPTHGENFGHAIAEALAVGLPCILSDTTPWSDIAEKRAGWAIPLRDRTAWADVLQQCVEMGRTDYEATVQRAQAYYAGRLAEIEAAEPMGLIERALRAA